MITWDEFSKSEMPQKVGQILTDISCPVCGKKIYFDNTIVLTTYPEMYQYWCSCGWYGSSYVKWQGE